MLQDEIEPDHAAPAGLPTVEISNGIARVHKEIVGRGPTSARTTIDGNLVVCLLDGGYTPAERTLERTQRGDLVQGLRAGLQEAMRESYIAVVQETLGRSVRSFMSANDLERNLQVEVFVLDDEDELPLGS